MNQSFSCLEDFPYELFHLIFDYLAPHHLLFAFRKLNQRFSAMIKQQPLYLPNNRMMNLKLYNKYLTEIIPIYSSRIISLHLSERRAPQAVDLFINEVPLNKLNWSSLKAVTIEDIPYHLFKTLLIDSSFLSDIQSLVFDISYDRYHHDDYKGITDYDIVIRILNKFRQLRSLHLKMGNRLTKDYDTAFIKYCHPMDIHQNLQSLLIHECSTQLLIELLDDSHLPQLNRLNISLACINFKLMNEPPRPIPLKHSFAPKLRYINVKLMGGVAWVLTYFEDLQRHSQIEQLNIIGDIRFSINGGIPRVTELHRWLTLTKSKDFTFQLKVEVQYARNDEQIRQEVLKEYRQAIGDKSTTEYGDINISYPKMSLSYPVMNINDFDQENSDSNDTSTSSDCISDNPVDENMKKIDLNKINLEGDFPDDNRVVVDNIPHLLHIVQRSPNLRKLNIRTDLDYGRILSSNHQLGILLASQLEILYFTVKEGNSSLGDLVQIVDTLFAHSTSSPCLKQLTLNVDGHPRTWVSTRHLVRWIVKALQRFPALIHFTLYCQHTEAFKYRTYSLSELAPEWYVISSMTQQNWHSSLNYRHKPHSLDIWL